MTMNLRRTLIAATLALGALALGAPTAEADTINSGNSISTGQSLVFASGGKQQITSTNGAYMTSLANWLVVIQETQGTLPVVATFGPGRDNDDLREHLDLQADGNLVLYSGRGVAKWATNTVGSGASVLVMQSDRNLVLYTSRGGVAWASNTAI